MRNPDRWKKPCGVLLLWATTAVALPAQTFTTLYNFNATNTNGPEAVLLQATDGNLYGTTTGGAYEDGMVFKITTSGTLTTLYKFCMRRACADGQFPYGALVQATDGNFYGTTSRGGVNGVYDGTVFKMTPSGALTTLYSFCSQTGCTDGQGPYAGLVQATDGNFYGTTEGGGAYAEGTVFKITPSGVLTTLYSFCPQVSMCTDGNEPYAGLLQATDGNLYGTTLFGGASGYGTVFKITLSGTLATLHSFDLADGRSPSAGLVQATTGDFYGTTEEGDAGGCTGGCGTVFKIAPGGTFTTLHGFDKLDGAYPSAGLVQATDGNFYGTTTAGGNMICIRGCGIVFQITPTDTLSVLHTFDYHTDGSDPIGGLIQDTDGNFYGTTARGGGYNNGTAFSLSVGLGPFVRTQPASGKVSAPVKILGTNLTGATSVTFSGTPATFTVVSSSLIITTVPVGATTGTVQVVTPGSGTLSSSVIFRVRP